MKILAPFITKKVLLSCLDNISLIDLASLRF